MDWISVSAACSAASEAIARISPIINAFVRDVRESRSEFDSISTELHSLDGVLDLLGYDAAFFPLALADHTAAVLATCLALVGELEGCISLLDRPGAARAEKKSRWLASREHIETLRWTLAQYKLVLGLAADLLGVTKSQTNEGAERDSPDHPPESPYDEAEDDEMELVAARIAEVSGSLEKDLEQSVALARLGQYLRVLQTQAVATGSDPESRLHTRRAKRTSSMGGAPDSAIDVSYDDLPGPAFRTSKQTTPPPSTTTKAVPWEEEMDEFVGELSEMPVQAPPLPPRSASRMSSGSVSRSPTQRPSTADVNSRGSAATSPCWPSTPSISISSPDAPQQPAHGSYLTPVTDLAEQIEHRLPRPETRTHSRRSSLFGPSLRPVWEHPRSDVPSPGADRPATSGHDTPQADRPASLLRRSGSKLSHTFRSLSLRRTALNAVHDDPEPDAGAVFGVPLTRSIQLAKGVASTRHGGAGAGGGSSPRATREYPLSVLRCVYHIRDCGLHVPQLFGPDGGDRVRVGQLKGVFNSAEASYGKELDWSPFTAHDAADVILVFLSELPKPVVPESVGKRWIALSRQATIRGARLDQGLDFWEEALMGVQGPGRALFKLLLNLWGDIADAAGANGMTAERLAGRVVGPLMHAAAARRPTDFMLGLAFLIRKRSEYNLVASGAARKSNAAF